MLKHPMEIFKFVTSKSKTKRSFQLQMKQISFRYFVVSGTAEKMLDYLLETYICVNCEEGDTSLDDFLSTYVVFMPMHQICSTLLSIYKAKPQQRAGENMDLTLQEKVKVIRFILEWHDSSKETFFEDPKINGFLDVT